MDLEIIGRSGIIIGTGDCYICKMDTDSLIIFSDEDTPTPYGFCLGCLKMLSNALQKNGCKMNHQTIAWEKKHPSQAGFSDINAIIYESHINGRVCYLLKSKEGMDPFWKVFVQDYEVQGVLESNLELAKKLAYDMAYDKIRREDGKTV